MNKVSPFFLNCFFLLMLVEGTSYGQQLHKHFELKKENNTEKVELSVSTKAGKSFLNAVSSDDPVLILGANPNDIAASTFKLDRMNSTQKVQAELTCTNHTGLNFTEAVAGSFFSQEEPKHDLWQLNLSENIAFNLSLNYLMGEANVDLSRLAIERLKINSASADVKLRYSDFKMNTVAMDTFFVKVNFGSIQVDDLNFAKARDIIAEVGFGSLNINCGSDWQMKSRVNASVGAGNLLINLPPDEIPVIIRIHDSPLCNIKMAENFKKIGHNAYGNEAYRKDPQESIEFILDVGMGSIAFKNHR